MAALEVETGERYTRTLRRPAATPVVPHRSVSSGGNDWPVGADTPRTMLVVTPNGPQRSKCKSASCFLVILSSYVNQVTEIKGSRQATSEMKVVQYAPASRMGV